MVQRNKLYLKPFVSIHAAFARMDARDREHRLQALGAKIAALESTAARGAVEFTVEDAIRD